MSAPAVQWYFGDWQRCAELRLCSLEARGLWIEMLGFMHQAKPYGHLIFEGKAVDAKKLANMVGGGSTANKVASLLKELGENGVYSRDENSVIYCRRMVRDQLKREAWRLEKQGQRSGQVPDNGPDKLPDKAIVSADSPVLSSDLRSSDLQNGSNTTSEKNTRAVPATAANPVSERSTSTPRAAAHSLAKASEHLAQQRAWTADPMPEGLVKRDPAWVSYANEFLDAHGSYPKHTPEHVEKARQAAEARAALDKPVG